MSELMFFEIPEKEGFSFEMWNPGPARKICTVRDGDIFDLGDKKLKVLEVPSHTLGCIALLEEKKGMAFYRRYHAHLGSVGTFESWKKSACPIRFFACIL